MDAWVICNPASGGGRGAERAAAATATLREHGWRLEVRATRGPGHATALAAEAVRRGVPTLLVAGGDGTTYEAVNGLFPRNGFLPTVGILPVGTGNSFLRDFGITDLAGAVHAVLRGETRGCDVVRAAHRGGTLHYLNLLSVGFSADVGSLTNRRFKRLGQAGYPLAVVASLVRLGRRAFPYRLDGGPRETAPVVLLSFSNSRFTGGTMMMAPDADPMDGYLDVVHIGAMGRRRLLGCFPRIYEGTHTALPEVRTARARQVDFSLREPVECMVDGEVVTLEIQRLEVLPAALQVLA